MEEDRPVRKRLTVRRRTVLQGLAVGSLGLAARRAKGQESGPFTISQGGRSYEVTPLSGSMPVEELYDLRIPSQFGGDNGATDPGTGPYFTSVGTTALQRESTTITFLYDGPNGLSLVVVHDKAGGTGGSASWTVSGSLGGTEWLVKDDFYTDTSTGDPADTNYDRWQLDGTEDEIDWTWSANATDGGVIGYLDDGVEVVIQPTYGSAAALAGQYYTGTVDAWQFLSGDIDSPDRIDLALDSTVEIRSGSKESANRDDTDQDKDRDDDQDKAEDQDNDRDDDNNGNDGRGNGDKNNGRGPPDDQEDEDDDDDDDDDDQDKDRDDDNDGNDGRGNGDKDNGRGPPDDEEDEEDEEDDDDEEDEEEDEDD